MAKRAPVGDSTYDPLDQVLAQSIINPMKQADEERDTDTRRAGEGTENAPSYARSVLATNPAHAPASSPMPAASFQPSHTRGFSRTKRVLLTPEEERDIERLVDRIAEQVGASLKLSHVLRACMALLCHAETELLRHASSHPLVRPANGEAVALAEFEQGIARLLSLALRDAPLFR